MSPEFYLGLFFGLLTGLVVGALFMDKVINRRNISFGVYFHSDGDTSLSEYTKRIKLE